MSDKKRDKKALYSMRYGWGELCRRESAIFISREVDNMTIVLNNLIHRPAPDSQTPKEQ